MSLARAESRRLVRRRFTSLILIGVLLVLAAVVVGTFLSTEKITPAVVAAAKADSQREYEESVRDLAQEKARCTAAQGTAEAVNYIPGCEYPTPQPEDFDYVWNLPPSFDLRKSFPDMITLFAVVFAAAAFLVGASFVGAEWNSGGMMNLLLWRPQRLRVLGAKLAVFVGWLTGLSVLLGAAWTGVFWQIASLRGSTEKMTPGVWQSFGLTGLRGLGLILAAGVAGFALASLGRHTGMALGALIGAGALQIGVYMMVEFADVPYSLAWLAPVWGYAWMYKEFVVENSESCNFTATDGCVPETFTMTWQMAGTGTAVLVAVILGATFWAMRRRDVA